MKALDQSFSSSHSITASFQRCLLALFQLLMRLSLLALLMPAIGQAEDSKTPIAKNRVSLYEAKLVCPAAPKIGCGSAAKPLLLELERDPGISEAWLNRAGTVIAIVWKKKSAPRNHDKLVQSVLKGAKGDELKGKTREETLKSFRSSSGWYRGAAVDRLSEEEAGIVAARLVRKIGEHIQLTEAKSKSLEEGFAACLKRRFTKDGSETDPIEGELLKVCREQLGEKEVEILIDAHHKGAFSHLLGE